MGIEVKGAMCLPVLAVWCRSALVGYMILRNEVASNSLVNTTYLDIIKNLKPEKKIEIFYLASWTNSII